MKHLLSFFLLILLFSCNKINPNYKITGQISSEELNGQTVYLAEYAATNAKPFDSAVVKGNSFVITGNIDYPVLALLSTEKKRVLTGFFIEKADIGLQINLDGNTQSIATGSQLNTLFNNYMEGMKPLNEKLNEFQQYARTSMQKPENNTEEFQKELYAKHEELNNEYKEYVGKSLKENPGTMFTALLMFMYLSQGGSSDEIQKEYDALDENTKKTALGIKLSNLMIPELAIGQNFRDLKLKTPDNKNISISDYVGKNKYVLLDFWASWCAPCRGENPKVVALYEKYKDKGLEIIGISLDETKEAWTKGIAEDKITWPQMSDLKGFESVAAEQYKIRSIPFTILLDKEGKITDLNLRGETLENKLEELFK